MACAIGIHHTVTLSDDGTIYSFGRNSKGQLGLGEFNDIVSIPTPIPNIPQITEIACGRFFTVCVDHGGGLWSFGSNNKGQLGTGSNTRYYNSPQIVEDIPPVRYVSCGYHHVLIITNDSNLWSCGRNDFGQLCLGKTGNQLNYQQTSFNQISKICTGDHHSLFQNDRGEIFGCGHNAYGEIGLGHEIHPQITVTLLPNLPLNIVQFSSGSHHSLFLDSDGKVFSVGYNGCGNLGLGHKRNQNVLNQISNIPPIRTISCTAASSYLIDVEGNVWSFGHNGDGKLGQEYIDSLNVIVYIPIKVPSLNNIVQISKGPFGDHFLAKDSQNKIFVAGYNLFGQLGTENSTSITKLEEMNSKYFPIWGEPQIICRAKSARK